MIKTLITDRFDAQERIDSWLSEYFDDCSRSYIQKLIKDGLVLVDGKPVRSSYRLCGAETISVDLPEPEPPDILPQDIPLDIIYEDDDLIFVNKPRGMVVHPAAGHTDNTLVNALLYHCKDGLSGINGIMRPGIVHRIDRDTSGILVVCKNDYAHHALALKFAKHDIKRRYYAICHGSFVSNKGIIDAPIGRKPSDRKKMAVVAGGRNAKTHYEIVSQNDKYSLVALELETGRTHQIRVHLNHISHPLLGDTVYGNRPNPFKALGQTLHAAVLGVEHPRSGKELIFTAPLPDYFTDLANKAGLDISGIGH